MTGGIDAFIEQIQMKKSELSQIIILFSALFVSLLLTCIYRDIYGMECRNAAFAKEMLHGLKFIPTYLHKPYPDYTPLFFWLEVFFAKVIGKLNTLATVLPSTVAYLGSVLLVYVAARRISNSLALLCAVILASFPKFWDRGAHVSIDMLLCLEVTGALISLYLPWQKYGRNTWKSLALAFTFIILAFFTKGLVGIVLPVAVWTVYLVITQKQKAIKPLAIFLGIAIIITIICISFELFMDYYEYNMAFVKRVIYMQITSRLESKPNQTLLYYPRQLINNTFPWWIITICVLFCVSSLKNLKAKWSSLNKALSTPEKNLAIFGICWFATIFLIFEIASCKHSRYILPALPGLALFMGVLICKGFKSHTLAKLSTIFKIIAFVSIFLPAIVIPLIPHIHGLKIPTLHIDVILICSILGLAIWLIINKHASKTLQPWLYTAMTTIFLMTAVAVIFTPSYSHIESGKPFMQSLDKHIMQLPHNMTNKPVYVAGIYWDGNGVKLSYYKPDDIRLDFLNSFNQLKNITTPFIVIIYKKDEKLLYSTLKESQIKLLCKGLVHKAPVEALIITKQPEAQKRISQ